MEAIVGRTELLGDDAIDTIHAKELYGGQRLYDQWPKIITLCLTLTKCMTLTKCTYGTRSAGR